MRTEWNRIALDTLGVLRAQGPEHVIFLQGQLSNDVSRVTDGHSLLAGYHNPQGRAIALLRLVRSAPDEILAVLPRELVTPVVHRLLRYVLRARVKLGDVTASWRVAGLVAPDTGAVADLAPAAALPAALNGAARIKDSIAVRVATEPARWLMLTPADGAPPIECAAAGPEDWHRLAVSSGEPQVYAVTSEEFVAQMLNFDLIGAIAFDKGCYTGQEIIARTHYRGRVKRRLQRFVTSAPLSLAPGDGLVVSGGRAVRIVDSAAFEDGRREFLAVAPLALDEPDEAPRDPAAQQVAAQPLPLPYPLPPEP